MTLKRFSLFDLYQNLIHVISLRRIPVLLLFSAVVFTASFGEDAPAAGRPRLTHADAAILFAKHLSLFDGYVADEASLDECVQFLNKTGIYFGLLEVINGAEFAFEDCARVMGQIELVLNGEAEYTFGKVSLPDRIRSWEEYCVLNGLEYRLAHQRLLESVKLNEG